MSRFQPVHERDAARDARPPAQVARQRVHQRGGFLPLGGHGQHAGGLVHHEQVGILVDDAEGVLLVDAGLFPVAAVRLVADGETVARRQGRRVGGARLAVEPHAAVVEQSPHLRVGQPGHQARQPVGRSRLMRPDLPLQFPPRHGPLPKAPRLDARLRQKRGRASAIS